MDAAVVAQQDSCPSGCKQSYTGPAQLAVARARADQPLSCASTRGDHEAESKLQLAIALQDQGDAAQALQIYQNLLSMLKTTSTYCCGNPACTKVQIREAVINRHIGVALIDLGRAREGLAVLESSLAASQKLGEADHEHERSRQTIANIGAAYLNLGEPQRALEYNEWYLRIVRQSGSDAQLLMALMNMGVTHQQLGQANKALEFLGRALPISTKVHGAEHSHTGMLHMNMGNSLHALGRNLQALECMERAKNIFCKTLGKDHPHVVSSFGNMAGVYDDLGEPEKALIYYDQELSMRVRLLGNDHPAVADTNANKGRVLLRQKRYAEALQAIQKAWTIRKAKLGPGHPETVMMQQAIETVRSKLA